MMKGFTRLPRPPQNTKPADGARPAEKPIVVSAPPEAVMHPCRPMDHIKPPPRIVRASSSSPERPVRPPAPPPVPRTLPAFMQRPGAEKPSESPVSAPEPVVPPPPIPVVPPRRMMPFGTLKSVPPMPSPSFLKWLATRQQPLRMPAPAPAAERSTGGVGRVSHVPRPKPPEPPVVIKYDKDGRPTLTPDDIPF